MYLRTRWPWAAATGLTLLAACEIAPHPTSPTSGAVVQIVVRPDSVALDPQQTQPFRAFGRTAAGDSVPATVRWSTSGGTIMPSGMYTADTSASDVLVTASLSTSQVSGTATVKKKRLVQILVSPASAVLAKGGVQQFTAYGLKNTGDSVSVNVSYTATGGAITQSGSYTAGQAMGSFQVMAKQNGGALADSSAVTVIAVPVASVAVSPAIASLTVGGTQQLAAAPRDSAGNPLTGRTITWTSSATGVATVSPSGLVTGVAAGSATITATSEGHSGTASLAVSIVPVASVTISPASAALLVGAAAQLTATPKDLAGNALTGRVVTWASSNTAVATVNGSGLVTGVTAGSATITATSEGKSGTATITVSLAPVASVSVTPAMASVSVGGTVQLTAALKDSAGNLLTGRTIAWSSSATGIATVATAGAVTGVTAGPATITATSEGKNGTSAITVVTPPPPTSCMPTYGSYGVGTWPPACYRLYDSTAWINRLLPANPQVDPNSGAIVAAFDSAAAGWSDGRPEDKGAGLVNDYDHPIYWAKASDPVYTLTGCGYSGALNGVRIHALKGMLPGGGSDGHVVVMDQSTNTEYEFWQAVLDDNARTIGGHACGRLSMFGDARIVNSGGADGDGGNAANTGLYAGQIRAVELVAGKIAHAIAVNAKCTNGAHVYPATGNALTCGGANQPADGQFFQLLYSDAEIDALPVAAWKKVVLHAMHQYGFYVDDTFGGDQHSFALHFESNKMFEAFGYEDPFVTYAKAHLSEDISLSGGGYYYHLAPGVDWSRIQVVKPCVIQRTC